MRASLVSSKASMRASGSAGRCALLAGLGKRGRGKGLGLGVELAWADGLGWEEGLRVGLLTGLGWVGYWAISFLFSILFPI